MILCIAPAGIKMYYEKKEKNTAALTTYVSFLAIMLGIEIGYFNMQNLLEIMEQTYKTNDFFRNINYFSEKNVVVMMTMIIACAVIALLGITLMEKIRKIKWKGIRSAIDFIVIYCQIMMIK